MPAQRKKPMSLDAFLRKVRRSGLEWFLDGNTIRYDGAGARRFCCPITALDPEGRGGLAYHAAARRLGLPLGTAHVLADAADNRLIGMSRASTILRVRVRRRLLRACRLGGISAG